MHPTTRGLLRCIVCSCPPAPNTDSGSYKCNNWLWRKLCDFPVVSLQQWEQRVYPTFLPTLTENRPIKSERKSEELCDWQYHDRNAAVITWKKTATITQSALALMYFLQNEKWVIIPLTVTPWTKAVLHHERQALTDGSRQEQTDGEILER